MSNEQSPAQSCEMMVNNVNKLILIKSNFVFLYQIDPNSPHYSDEKLTLINSEANWQKTLPIPRNCLGENWVKIKFTDIPEEGSFDLLQDPNDGQPAYYIFDQVPYAELNNQTPETTAMAEITEE